MKYLMMFVLLFSLCGCRANTPYTFSFNDHKDHVRNPIYLDKNHTYTSTDFELITYDDFIVAIPKRLENDYKGTITMNDTKKFTFTIKKIESDPFYNQYPSLNSSEHVFDIIDYDTLISLFDEGDHIVYLGFPRCPWCVEYVTYYNEAAKALNKRIKYYDIQALRQIEGNALASDYQALIDKVDPQFLSEITKDGVIYPWIYAPTLYIIKDGKVIDVLVGGMKGHNIREGGLTEAQKKEFISLLETLFNKISK
ncbi:MAG: hypothetical protein WC939_00155 [Acholeplasmataceae bacterium]